MRLGSFYKFLFGLIVFLILLPNNGKSQSPFSCNGTVTTYTADFTTTTNNSLTFSNLAAGVGECCGFSTNSAYNCYTFSVKLDQSSLSAQQNGVGVDFVVNGSAVPVTIRRSTCTTTPTYAVGEDICLAGPGPHWFNICLQNTGPISITVNQLAQQSDVTVCSGEVVQNSNFINSASNLGNYTWTASNALQIGLPFSSGTGNIGSFTAQNTTNPQTTLTSTVTVTPVVGSCRTIPFTYKIIVNPAPSANFYSPANQCLTGNSFLFSSTGNQNGTHSWTFPSASPVTTSSSVNPAAVTWNTPGTYTVTHQVTLGTCTDIETRPVSVFPQPNQPTLTADYPNCSTRSILVNPATGGTPDYTYSIDNTTFGPLQDYTNLAAGTYTVYIRDANACANSSTITLQTILGPTDFTLNSTTAHCNQADGTIAVSNVVGGTIPYTYSAQSSTTSFPFTSSSTFNAVPSGTYTVTVKDNNGCTFTKTVTIGNTPGPSGPRASSVKSTCGLSNGSVTLQTPTTGTGPFTYAFNNNGATFSSTTNYTNLLAATYTYVVKDPFGCPLTGTIVVGNTAGPSALTVNTTNALCGNPTGNLTIVAPSGATAGTSPYTYSVSTVSTTFTTTTSFPSVSPGPYTVTVKDANACTYSVTANIANIPGPSDVALTTTNSTCGNSNGAITIGGVTGGTSPYTYSVTSVSAGYSSTTSYTNVSANTYTVNVKDANNCVYSETFTVSNTSGPTAVATTTTAATCGNNNGSITLGAVTGGVAPYTYSVSTVSASFGSVTSFPNLAGGNYTVSIRDANSCTYTVSVNVPTAAATTSVAVTTTNSTCGNANGIITIGAVTGGTSPFTYSVSSLAASYSTTTSYTNAAAATYTVSVKDASGCVFTRTVAVSNTAGPTNVVLSSTNSTCGNANGTISIGAVTGGTSPFTYSVVSLSAGYTSSTSYTNAVATTYSVNVKDANGCIFTKTVAVSNTAGPTAIATTTTSATCGSTNGSLTIGATTGGSTPFTYSFNGGAYSSTTSYINLAASIYTVSVKDAINCTYSVTTTISNSNGPTSVVTNTTAATCGNNNGSISLGAVTGGVSPYTYSVSSVSASFASTTSFPNLAGGTYTISVRDANTCTYSVTATVPSGNAPTSVSVTTTNSTCGASNGIINIGAVTGGTSPYTYSITTISTGFTSATSYTGVAAASYTLSVKDANNCIYTTPVILSNTGGPTAAVITPTSATCGNNNGSFTIGAITGGTSPYTYSVNPGSSGFTSTTSYGSINSGTYSVTLKDANGCTYSVTTNVPNSGGPTNVALSSTNSTCGNANGVITIGAVTGGTSAFTYSVVSLSAGYTSTTSYTNASATTYSVNVKDANGCIFTKTVTVSNTAGPTAQTVTTTSATCGSSNGSLTIGATTGGTGSYTYSFNGGAFSGTTNYPNLAASIYTITVKDGNNCTYSVSATVSNTNGPSSIVTNTTAATCGNNNGSLTLGAVTGGVNPFTYSVSTVSGSFGSTTSFPNLAGGTYTITVRDANTCSYSVTATVPSGNAPTSVSVTTTNSTCGASNGIINIGAVTGGTSPYTYSLTTLSASFSSTTSYTGVAAASYTLSVKDANNCTYTTSVSVSNTGGPSAAVITPTSATCGNANGSFTIGAITGGTSPYTYSVNPGSSGFTSTTTYGSLSSGTYSVTVKDANACTFSVTTTVNNAGGPSNLNVSTTNSTCGSATGTLTIGTVTGGTSPYTYSVSTLSAAFTSTTAFSTVASATYSVTVKDANACTFSVTATVSNTSGPSALSVTTTNSTCGSSNGSISIGAVTGGVTPYTYSVSSISGSFASTTNFISVAPNNYTVTVKDANACTFSVTTTVSNTGGPSSIDVVKTNATCGNNNGTISLGVVTGGISPYTYSLSTVSGSFSSTTSFTGLAAATYTISVKDANNCTYTVTSTVSQLNSPTNLAVTNSSSTCGNANGVVTIGAVTGGTSPYTYSLTSSSSTYSSSTSYTNVVAGTQTVTVKDANNCTYTVTTTISNIAGPTNVALTFTNSTCGNAVGVIQAGSVTGGTAPYTYSLSPGAQPFSSTTTFNNIAAGIYTVTVKDANSCTFDGTVTVGNSNGPTGITVNTTNSICGSTTGSLDIASVTGGTAPFTYSVSPGPSGFNATTNFINLSAGSYTVTVRDNNTCTFSVNSTVANTSGPTALAFTTTNSTCGNANGAITIGAVTNGTAPFTYSVVGVSSSFTGSTSYTGLSAGTYQVIVRDNNLCTHTESATVSNTSGPNSMLVTPQNSTCGDSNGSLIIGSVSGGTSPYNYSLNNGVFSSTASYTGLAQGTFTVSVRDANACTYSTTVNVSNAGGPSAQIFSTTPTACGSNTGVVIFGTTSGGNGIYTYSFNGSGFSSNTTYSGLAAGTYVATVKDGNNCSYSENVTVTTAASPTALSVTSTDATCSQTNGAITIGSASGGTAPYTYSVSTITSGFVNNTSFTNLSPGTFTVTVRDANACTFSVTTSFINNAGPTALSVIPSSSTCGNANGLINIGAATGGTSPFTYSVSNVTTGYASSTLYNGLSSGNYTVTVKDANACTYSVSTAISNIAGPTSLNVTTSNSTCGSPNGSITIGVVSGGTSAYTYSVSSISASFGSTTDFTSVLAGTYIVTVQDANLCTYSVTAIVSNAAAATAMNISKVDATCGLANGSFNIGSVSGGTPPYQYSVNNGPFNSTILYTNLSAGTYSVTVRDNNSCTLTNSITINAFNGPSDQDFTILPSSCSAATGSVQFGATIGGNGVITYSFNGTSFTGTTLYTSIAAGTYIATVKDGNNCQHSETVIVPNTSSASDVVITKVDATCSLNNGSISLGAVTGGAAPFTYSLSTVTPAFSSVNSFTNLSPGTYTISVKDANACTFTVTTTITSNPGPSALTITNTTSTCGLNNGTITVSSVTGGTTPYTYSVSAVTSGFVSGSTISNVPGGTYTVTVKDANACTFSGTTTVNNIAGSTAVSVITTNSTCGQSNGSLTIGAITGGTAPFTYSVSTLSGSFNNTTSYNNIPSGTYTVSVRDNSLCTYSVTATVSDAAAPASISVTKTDAICGLNNGTIDITSVNGGTPSYSYSVNGAIHNSTSSYSNLSAGTYTISIKDANTCTYTTTIIVDNFVGPTDQVVSSTNSRCDASTGSITLGATIGGFGVIQYALNNTSYSGLTAYSNLATGTYTVYVKDGNNCVFTKTVSVGVFSSPFGMTLSSSNATCGLANGSVTVGTVTGGTAPYTYSVSPGVGAYSSNPTLSGISGGTYTLTVKDANGCTFSNTTSTVTLIDVPGPTAASVSTTNAICGSYNGTITVDGVTSFGSTSYQYAVNGGLFGSSNTFTGIAPGTYTVVTKDGNNCTVSNTVTVTDGGGITSFSLTPTNTNCGAAFGSIAVSNVVGGAQILTYSIDGVNFQTSDVFPNLLPNTYTITVKDNNNCSRSQNTVVSDSPGPADFILSSTNANCGGSDGTLTIGAVVGGTGPGYTYSVNNSAFTSTTSYTSLITGTYTVTVKDINGCSFTKTISVGSSPGPSSINLTSTNPTCGNSNASIVINSVPGAAGTVSYSLNNAVYSSSNSYTNLLAGTYTVSVKDGNNCVFTRTLVLNNVAGPSDFNATVTNSFCSASSGSIQIGVVVGGTGPTFTYSINNGPLTNANSFQTLGPGTYTLTVADANTCTYSKTVSITTVSGPTDIDFLIDTASCGLANGSIIISNVTGGAGAYQYAINGGANQFSNAFNLVLPLTHTVLVTDANGCTYQETINVPNLTGPYAQQISTVNSVCGQINGVVNIGITNGGTAPYQFSFDGSTLSTTTSYTTSPGTHTVIVSDANACTFTVTPLVVDIAGPVSFNFTLDSTNCGNPNGSISVNGIISGTIPFQYSIDGTTFQSSNNFTNLLAGGYTVTVKDANGCIKEQSTILPDLGTPVVVIQSKRNVTCFGNSNGSLTVSGSGGQRPYVFSLNNGQVNGSGIFNNLAPGNYTITITDAGNCTSTATFEITSPSAPLEASIGSTTDVLCNGASSGSAMVSQTGGVSPYMYALNGGLYSTTNQFTSLSATTYSVSVKDDNGCIVVVPFTITQPGLINLVMTSVNTTCSANNGTASVAPSGGVPPYTYSWSGGGGTNSITGPLPVGNYTVTVTDANSCTQTNSVTISLTQNNPAVFSTVRNVTCNGLSDGLLTVSAGQGFTPPFTYTWSSNANTGNFATASGLGIGSYSVTVLDANGCSSTVFASISEPLALNINFSATNVSCNNGIDGTITANVTGGTTPYLYSWSPGLANTSTASGLSAGTYTLEVNDANGCRIVRTRSITEPSVIVPIPVVTSPNCQQANGSISLTASGGAGGYSYAINGGNFGIGAFNGLIAATYTVSVKDQNNCVVSAPVSLVDINGPTATITSSTNNTCFGGNNGSATVLASGGTPPYTYFWTPSSQVQPTAVNLAAGIYGVTVRDNQGCAASASIVITQPDSFFVNTSGINPRCNGQSNGSAIASAGGGVSPYVYQWQVVNAPAGPSITGLSFGSHTITVTDANGCIVRNTITLSNPSLFTANIAKTIPSCNGLCDGSATVTSTNGVGSLVYQWNDPNNQTTQTASGLCAGNYTVSITDFNGCIASAAVTLSEPAVLVSALANVNNISCAGVCNGSAEVIASGGTPPYAYDWTNGSTSSTVSGLCATTYSAEVTDSKGCVAVSVLQVSSPAPLTLDVSSTDILCHGQCTGTATATFGGGTAPYSFNWFPSLATVYNPTALCDGIHSVTITDANGCQLTDTTLINEPAPFTASTNVIGNNLCNQSNGSAQVLVTGGTSPFIYDWNNGGSTAIISSLQGGVYSVDVTDANGCIASAIANVNDLPAPLLTLISSDNISCFGLNDGTANVSVSGGTAPISQTWLLPTNLNANPDQSGNGLWPGDNVLEVVDAAGCVSSITVPITEPLQLVGNIGGLINVSCYNYNDGSASMLVTGGTSPYSYSWNDPANQVSATAVGLPAGTFICQVVDDNGCTVSDSILINQPPSFLINVNAITNVRCYGDNDGSISITASGGSPSYTYSWTPNTVGNGPQINNLTGGSYTLTVTDNRGCNITADYFVSQPDSFNIVSTIDPSTCTSPNASITINVTGATPPFIFQWNDPNLQTSNTATGLVAPANYNCLITDSRGCTKVFSATTTDIPAPSIDSIISTPVRCYGGQDGTLTVYAQVSTGGGNLSYQWLNSSSVIIGNGSFQGGLPLGTYSIVITDGNGCTVTGSGNVTQPFPLAITVSQNQTACNGQTLGIYASAGNGTPPYTYTWSGAGTGLNGPGIHNVLFTNTTTTSDVQLFNVTATDANNCPAVSGQFFVTVLPKISIVASDNNACFGQNVTLSALASGGDGAPYEFFWATSPPQTQTGSSSTISIPVLSMSPQSYNLLVSDGCSTSEMTVVDVIPNPKPIPAITAINTQGCEDLDVSFTGSAGTGIIGTAYEWTFGDGTFGLGENTTHIYSLDSLVSDTFDVQLVVTSNLGCKDTLLMEDYVIVYPKPVADFITMPSSATEFDPYFEFYNYSLLGVTYLWNFDDSLSNANTATTTNSSHYYLSTGYYNPQLIAVTDRGCRDTISKSVYIEPQFTVFVPNAFTPNRDKKNDVFIPVGIGMDAERYLFQIFDRWGNLVFQTTDSTEGWTGLTTNGVDYFAEDVYIWKLETYDLNGNKIDRKGRLTLVR